MADLFKINFGSHLKPGERKVFEALFNRKRSFLKSQVSRAVFAACRITGRMKSVLSRGYAGSADRIRSGPVFIPRMAANPFTSMTLISTVEYGLSGS